MLERGDRFADRDLLDAGKADNVARDRAFDFDALETIEREEFRNTRLLCGTSELQHRHGIVQRNRAVEYTADRDSSEVVARIEVGDENLQGRIRIASRRRHMPDDSLEQRLEVFAVCPGPRGRHTVAATFG